MTRVKEFKLGMEVQDRLGQRCRVCAISRDTIAIEAYDYDLGKWSGVWEYVTRDDVWEAEK